MSNDVLTGMDADMAAAFLDVGMADAATLTAPEGGTPVACTVMVDRNIEFFGGQTQMASRSVTITAQVAEVGTPVRKSLWTVGADTWRTDDVLDGSDESLVVCLVTKVPAA